MDKEKRNRLITIIAFAVVLLAAIATVIGVLKGCPKDGNNNNDNNNPAAHTVTFINGSENFDSRLVLNGDKATLPSSTPVKQNTAQFTYEFDGWYKNLDDATAFDFESSTITESITLYAKFAETVNKYTVAFVAEAQPYGEVQDIAYGEKSTEPSVAPTKQNTAQFTYEFDGWYKNLDDATAFDFESSAITENVTLYAKFTETDVLLNYNINADGKSYSVTGAKNNKVTDIRILERYNNKPVTSIGSKAFYEYNNLKTAIIPDSITSVDESAFALCGSLTTAVIPDSVTTIGRTAFALCGSLTTAVISDSVTSIGYGAFTECLNLKDVTIGKNVKIIDEGAFDNCKSLTSITIPDGVTTIGARAFNLCSRLMSVTIPDSVTTIGARAFNGCKFLIDVTIGKGVESIEGYTFSGCTSLENITIGENVTQIGSSTFGQCSNLSSLTIPDSVKSIGADAFSYCTRLTTVTIGKSVTSIDNSAFKACSDLTITIADGNTAYKSVGNCLIETATKTLIWGGKRSVIPSDGSVTIIGETAFFECVGLESITIPDNVTTIGMYAFCRNDLKSIIIGSGITSIDSSVFSGCNALRHIAYHGTKEQWGAVNSDNPTFTDELYYTIIYEPNNI